MKTLKVVTCLTLAVVLSAVTVADEKEKKGKNRQRKAPSVTARFVKGLELSEEQKGKLAAIDKEYGAKLKELAEKRKNLLTEDQKKAQAAAMKEARAARGDGKPSAEARKKLQAAVKLTEEQQKQQKEISAAQREVQQAVIASLRKILTAEQQEKLPKARPQRKGKEGAKKEGAKKRAEKKKADEDK